MRALIQRVSEASVAVSNETIGHIGRGLVVLLAVSTDDTLADAEYTVNKTINMRIFPDEEGRFNFSALDVAGELLVISQFTLYADTRKGRRPSFTGSAPPETAEKLFNATVDLFTESGVKVETGEFQAHMMVSLTNDGPVTIMIDSADRNRPRRGQGTA